MTVTVEMPGLFWRANDGSAYATVWRDEGPGQPVALVAGRDWQHLRSALGILGIESELSEAEVTSGHGSDPRPFANRGPIFFKKNHEFHYAHSTQDFRIEVQGGNYGLFVDFCERLGLEDIPTSRSDFAK